MVEVMGTPLYFEELCKQIFPKCENNLTIIEVGTWKGASAFKMISACGEKTCKMYCVDTWLGSIEHYDTIERDDDGFPCIFKDFWNNVKQRGYENIITPVTLPSQDALEYFTDREIKADVIYVDAAHDFKNTLEHLRGYWKLLKKKGSVMIVDDFHDDWYGVKGAVQIFAFEIGIPFVTCEKTCFFVKK